MTEASEGQRAGATTQSPWLSRLSGAFSRNAMGPRKASPGLPADEGKRKAVLQLDDRERKIGLLGGALALLIALVTTVPYVLDPSKRVSQTLSATKDHHCLVKGFVYTKSSNACVGKVSYPLEHWLFALILMVAFAAAILVTVKIGRRGPLGFIALMTGLAFDTQVGILGLPFVAGGGWLLVRAWRVQRYGSPTAPRGNSKGTRSPPDRTRPGRANKDREPQALRKAPGASKRYTPKSTSRRKRPAPAATQEK
ncbi:MAG: hypothetical protein ACRDVP_11955 [Acidimicrobiales bacterium]